ncbi:MAG: 3-phosphoshikimate 1-carboxyvinyltransferase [Thermoplasmatota archaeon]
MIIEPIDRISGKLKAPSSKSYTHRVLFAGLLVDGKTTFENPLRCKDTEFTLKAVNNFGADINWKRIENDGLVNPANINAGESGTTARISIAIASLADGISRIDGDTGLRKRPMKSILNALSSMNIKSKSKDGKLPVIIEGGNFESDEVDISGRISSQFITALLYIGSKIGLTIKVTDKLVSKPYIDMTIEVLKQAGVKVERNNKTFKVEKGIKPTHYHIPGDYSSASFMLASGALFGEITINNLSRNGLQADKKIVELLKEFGANICIKDNNIYVEKDSLEGFEINCDDFPDLFPILTVLGTYAKGETIINGKQLRYKESDRINNMVVNLKKMGADIEELENGVRIRKSKLKGAQLNPRSDHRIAMALTIAALGAEGKSLIKNSNCVSKSYPDFFNDLREVVGYGR